MSYDVIFGIYLIVGNLIGCAGAAWNEEQQEPTWQAFKNNVCHNRSLQISLLVFPFFWLPIMLIHLIRYLAKRKE